MPRPYKTQRVGNSYEVDFYHTGERGTGPGVVGHVRKVLFPPGSRTALGRHTDIRVTGSSEEEVLEKVKEELREVDP